MPRRRLAHAATGGNIRIRGGQVLPKALALVVCRCEECLGPVARWNNTVRCAAHPEEHQHLIHRKEAAAEAARREAELIEVEQSYVIRDGQLVAVDDHTTEGD